jgi:hypothetical protein
MFYTNPNEEVPRITRVFEKLNVLNKTQGTNPRNDLFFVIKGWNDNIVSYSYVPEKNIIKTEWISLETSDRERHESNGNFSLKNDLSESEKTIFGCSLNIIEGNRFIVTMNVKQIADRTNELILDENDNPSIIGMVNGKLCKLKYAYAQMKNSMLPEVDYLNLYGENLEDGQLCVEKIFEKEI